MDNDPYHYLRETMVREQIMQRGLHEPRLLEALRKVPRHAFVPQEQQPMAYEDRPLPVGQGQTISQPYIVALMTSLLQLHGGETVLEIGTGSGYQAAVLAELARQVHTVERLARLAQAAADTLSGLGYANVTVHFGDGSAGWPGSAPYDAILITAAVAGPPRPVLEQLAPGGRLVLPTGDARGQVLQVWQVENGRADYENITPVSFVPLRGQYGWSQQDWERREDFNDWL